MRTTAPAPGAPVLLTVTPAARPCNWAARFAAGVALRSSVLITDTAPMMSFFFEMNIL